LEGDDLILLAMNDEKRGVDFGNVAQVGEAVAKEKRNAGDDAKGAEEGRNEDEAAMVFFRSQPAARARADRLPCDDDITCGDFERFGEVRAVTSFFGGLTATFSVSRIVVGDDAEALSVKIVESAIE